MEKDSLFDGLYAFLKNHYPALEGNYFSKSLNRFGPHPLYLYDTPHGCWGLRQLPVPHSKRLTDEAEALIANAAHQVDITNLRLPSGEFKEAIITGINRNTSTRPLQIRILCGRGGMEYLDAGQFVKDVQAGINKKPVALYVGVQTNTYAFEVPKGWNHAKYIAVDGKIILCGGHNYIGDTYMGHNAIFDISIKLEGPIATRAHFFSNELWKFVNNNGGPTYSTSLVNNVIETRKVPMFSEAYDNSITNCTLPVMHVTQPGHGLLDNGSIGFPNPSASSIYYAMANAQHTIHISQQDIMGMGGVESNPGYEGVYRVEEASGYIPFVSIRDPQFISTVEIRYADVNLFNAITGNLIKNPALRITMVLSNQGSKSEAKENNGYSNNTTAACVFRALGWFMVKRLGKTVKEAQEILKAQVTIRTIGLAHAPRWEAAPYLTIGNHAKYWSVDDKLCSIGSNNMYPSTVHRSGIRTGHHQEWAVIIGNNAPVVAGIRSDYFQNLFNYSVDAAFRDNFLDNLQNPQGFPKS
jgi:PLD-like domain